MSAKAIGPHGLTPKREAFAQAVAAGKSLSDAYRGAYDCARSTEKSINEAACRLMACGKVTARVDSLRAELADKTLWTREKAARVLLDVIANPDKASDRIAAVRELNLMHGYNAPLQVDQAITIRRSYGIDMPRFFDDLFRKPDLDMPGQRAIEVERPGAAPPAAPPADPPEPEIEQPPTPAPFVSPVAPTPPMAGAGRRERVIPDAAFVFGRDGQLTQPEGGEHANPNRRRYL